MPRGSRWPARRTWSGSGPGSRIRALDPGSQPGPEPPVSDLFAMTGRHWLSRQVLPPDERSSVQALLRQLDFHGEELAIVDKERSRARDPAVAHLMTIPGVDAIAGDLGGSGREFAGRLGRTSIPGGIHGRGRDRGSGSLPAPPRRT